MCCGISGGFYHVCVSSGSQICKKNVYLIINEGTT